MSSWTRFRLVLGSLLRPLGRPRRAQIGPRGPQERPKKPQDRSKTPHDDHLDAKNCFSKSIKKSSVTNKIAEKRVSLHYALKWFFVFFLKKSSCTFEKWTKKGMSKNRKVRIVFILCFCGEVIQILIWGKLICRYPTHFPICHSFPDNY